jgi:hypothetical protein
MQDACEDPILEYQRYEVSVKQNIHPLKRFLRSLWLNLKLFFETDKWEPTVTLKVGDSHYMMKMDDIEKRWRKP